MFSEVIGTLSQHVPSSTECFKKVLHFSKCSLSSHHDTRKVPTGYHQKKRKIWSRSLHSVKPIMEGFILHTMSFPVLNRRCKFPPMPTTPLNLCPFNYRVRNRIWDSSWISLGSPVKGHSLSLGPRIQEESQIQFLTLYRKGLFKFNLCIWKRLPWQNFSFSISWIFQKCKVPYTFVRFLNLESFFPLGKEPNWVSSWIRTLSIKRVPSAKPSNPGRASNWVPYPIHKALPGFFLCIFSSLTCLKKPVFSKPDLLRWWKVPARL